jgi:hypothetical protein
MAALGSRESGQKPQWLNLPRECFKTVTVTVTRWRGVTLVDSTVASSALGPGPGRSCRHVLFASNPCKCIIFQTNPPCFKFAESLGSVRVSRPSRPPDHRISVKRAYRTGTDIMTATVTVPWVRVPWPGGKGLRVAELAATNVAEGGCLRTDPGFIK